VAKTLRPVVSESVEFNDTQNLFIEGDNLDGLKLLQETFLNKFKIICIDPPYNTGQDFLYEDDFAENLGAYLEKSNQKDELGSRLITNTESNGRFHSDWLSMMYPRLKLARNLLREDGVIFVTISDGEVGNLRKLSDEIFGEANFVANIIWQKKYTRANDAKWFSDNHDHILCFARDKSHLGLNNLPRSEEQLSAYSNPDNHPKGRWKATPLHAKSGTNTMPYTFLNGTTWAPPAGTFRRFNDDSMKAMDEGNEIWFGADGKQTPSRKSFLNEIKVGVVPVTIWPYDEVGHNHEANNELKELELSGVFDNPKPSRLFKRAIFLASSTQKDDIVLDFFAGSATTASAVMTLNAEDGGNRRFILMQLAEPCDETSVAFKEGFASISDVSKERIRRAGSKTKAANAPTAP
jgi:adenine-specific DNA-methyltransferase